MQNADSRRRLSFSVVLCVYPEERDFPPIRAVGFFDELHAQIDKAVLCLRVYEFRLYRPCGADFFLVCNMFQAFEAEI